MIRLPRLLLPAVATAALLALGLGCYDSFGLLADAGDDVFPPRDEGPGDSTADAADVAPDARDDAHADTPADRSDDSPDAAETESDAHADSEADRPDATDRPDSPDAEADVPADTTDGLPDEVSAESDGATETCPGGWFDPSSGLCWQNPPSSAAMSWEWAVSDCAASTAGGIAAGSWHLPTIDELRSLVRSCSRTETGGACGVTDSCLEHDCWALTSCNECLAGGGPAAGGAYWPDELTGTVAWYWSASSYVENPSWAWFVSYYGANISWDDKTSPGYVRCVRRG